MQSNKDVMLNMPRSGGASPPNPDLFTGNNGETKKF